MRNFSGFRPQLLLGGALLAVIASSAHAATGTAADPAPAADAAAADGSEGLGEVIVTATKRETNLQRTPIAINVLDTQAVKERHVQSLYDLADGAIPSLRVATFEARQTALTIGIRSDWLFAPEDVSALNDALIAAGVDARYRELDSPHGHDAFLKEWGMLDPILREFLA